MSDAPRPWSTGMRVSAVTLTVFLVAAIVGPWVAPHDPALSIDLVAAKLQPPSAAHWFGTDAAARDVFSRFLFGTRVSIGAATVAVAVVLVIGVTWGTVAGLASHRIDRAMMWVVDGMLAMPRLLIVLALVAFLGRLSPTGLAFVIGMTSWPQVTRIVRARVREVAVADHVAAARALGAPLSAVVFRHVLPGVWPAVIAGVAVTIATVIPLEAALSYFGAGIAPPDASWGTLLQDATARPLETWWLLLFPSVAIAATVMSVNVLGDHLTARDGVRREA